MMRGASQPMPPPIACCSIGGKEGKHEHICSQSPYLMDIEREDLDWAVEKGILTEEQAGQLWTALEERSSTSGSSWFDVAFVAYYGGALLVVVAMSWFMLRVAEEFGYLSLMGTALVYGGTFLGVGLYLRRRRELQVAGGLFVVLAVTMVPVVLYNLERATPIWAGAYGIVQAVGLAAEPASFELLRADLYERLKQDWLLEEFGTVVAGILALRYVRFPFLTAPIAFALWAMATITAPDLLVGEAAWQARLWVSVAFGVVILMGAYLVDRRTEADYAFWGYLFGLLAFWGGLTTMEAGSEWTYLGYGLLNVVLVGLGIFLERRAFLMFGSLGVFLYLGHLAYEVFADSVYFPLALSGIGVGLIYLGIKYQQNRAAIERLFWTRLPPSLRQLSPRQR